MIENPHGSLLPAAITVTFENATDQQTATFHNLGHTSYEKLPPGISVSTYMRFLRDQFMAHHGAEHTVIHIYEGAAPMMEIVLR